MPIVFPSAERVSGVIGRAGTESTLVKLPAFVPVVVWYVDTRYIRIYIVSLMLLDFQRREFYSSFTLANEFYLIIAYGIYRRG